MGFWAAARARKLTIAVLTAFVFAAVLLVPAGQADGGDDHQAFVPHSLEDAASAQPRQLFRVILQGRPFLSSSRVGSRVATEMRVTPAAHDRISDRFSSINAVAAELTGRQILELAERRDILAITPDAPLRAGVADPPVALEPPSVFGTAQDGESLTTTPGQWSSATDLAYAYQWQRCDSAAANCADVTNAIAPSYTVGPDDVGSTLVIVVTVTNADGTASSTSAATSVVVAAAPPVVVDPTPPPAPQIVPPAAAALPALAGTAADGQTLSASDGLWTSGGVLQLTRQWQRCSAAGESCLDIPGADTPTYLVGPDDVGSTLRILVSATDAFGTATATSAVSDLVAGAPSLPPLPAVLVAPSVDGTPTAGLELSAGDGLWSGEGLQLTRQWQRCTAAGQDCADITGADTPTYLLGPDDIGSTLRLLVTATSPTGTASAASATTDIVAAPPPPPAPPTLPPVITGTPQEGSRLVATSTVAEAVFAWQRCDAAGAACADISGASGSIYTLVADDVGSTLRAVVASDVSEPTAIVLPARPVNLSTPTIIGAFRAGSELTASPGTWTSSAPLTYAYAWKLCDAAGQSCTAAGDAASYAPLDADVGSLLQVFVTATNDGGATTAASTTSVRIAPASPSGFWSWQIGPYAAGADAQWTSLAAANVTSPAVAVVDSGVDPTLPGLQGAVVQSVTLTGLPQSAAADGYGHGSFVAEVAAGRGDGQAGAAPTAPIVSLDVMDDNGMALTSDVVAAADWIYSHKNESGIRVANFSLIGSSPASVMFDPLDRALERLWLSGVVVVTASGNYGVDGRSTDVAFAPANDPFVITVGASDPANSLSASDDFAAPWSAYGHTFDGFAKPELGAPGRYVVAPVPTDSTLYRTRPDRIVTPGRLQLSGTSFAAPLVAGIAANLLALHPEWTPDQVKGALMLTAVPVPAAAPYSLGVGEVDAAAASTVADPPNPNAALEQFLTPDPQGGDTPVLDTASWGTAAQANASWGTASWGTASWGTASWGTASWGTNAWSAASWGTASWGTASWGTASWGTASWGTASWGTDLSSADVRSAGGYWMRWPR